MRRVLLFGFLLALVGAAAFWHARRFGVESAPRAGSIREGTLRTAREEDSLLIALGGGPALVPASSEGLVVLPPPGVEAARAGSPTGVRAGEKAFRSREKEVLVRAGDCLSRIVLAHYGEARPSLIEAVRRRNALPSPDRLREGTRLVLPAVPTAAAP